MQTEGMAARVRHMEPADAAQVSDLVRTSWLSTYGPLMGEARAARESAAKHQPEMIEASLSRPHAESFVAVAAGGRVVGYAHAIVVRGVLWLDRLHVVPEQRGSGIATALLHAVIVNYTGEGTISLEVLEGNERALRFYQREGFVVTERRDACGGIADVPTLIMRKAIPRA